MDFSKKKKQLTDVIQNTLVPLIDNDFVLMDLPYYSNIGDVLIWEGELHFLKQYLNKYSLLYTCSLQTCNYPKLEKKTIILLQGGGNFGDLHVSFQEFRRNIIIKYPFNKIIIFPQTVWYNDEQCLLKDAETFSMHNNITICARDKNSYNILKRHFSANKILLVPDMAFCIPSKNLSIFCSKQENKTLFLKRSDKELNTTIDYSKLISETEFDTHDWPSREKFFLNVFFMRCFSWASRKIPVLFPKLTDIYASVFFKPNIISTGVKFISKYNTIYTTRLHVAILCCLLEKPCIFFDNSYGKNSSFFETWLDDLNEIRFISPTNTIL